MIKLIEGLHLTATNKRHLSQMVAAGMRQGQSGQLSYLIEPLPDNGNRWRFHMVKQERDDWGRPAPRHSKGIFECAPLPR